MKTFGALTISEGGYADYLDCICIKYVTADKWNQYEAGEAGAEARLFFGKLLEKWTPVLTAGGLLYRICQRIYHR